jgi:hypothetical protein
MEVGGSIEGSIFISIRHKLQVNIASQIVVKNSDLAGYFSCGTCWNHGNRYL